MIPDDVVQEIRDSANIREIIGHYIPLVKKGRGYTALCPFHDDHDPSLSISEEKQIYKCFVCGKGGNVFRFVMDYKHCSFEEAVVEVADIIGKPLKLDIPAKKPKSKYERYYNLMKEAQTFCNYLLFTLGGKEALTYLEGRGLNKDIIDRFGIGYNPKENVLYQYLKNKGYSDDEMIATNLARMTDYGMQDVFYDRIMFPIYDEYGHCIAFSARTMGQSQAKYINSSETKIYTKGHVLYNADKAKEAIKSAGRVVVCEGVMDVIAFARSGIDYAVATLGTACSNEQLKLLHKLSPKLVLAYDGDDAGQNAILKLGKAAYAANMQVMVIDNQTGLDPDEIVNKYKDKALRDLLGKEIHFIDYAINYYRKRYNLNNYSDRKEMTIKVGELIDLVPDEYDRINFEKTLFDITKIQKIATVERKKWYNEKKVFEPEYSMDGLAKAEYTILCEMAISKRAAQIYQEDLGCMLSDDSETLAVYIIEEYRKYGDCHFNRIYDKTDNEAIRKLITDLATIESLPKKYSEDILKGAILKVKQEIQLRKLAKLRQEMTKIATVDPQKAQEYLKEYTHITKELGGTYGKKNSGNKKH